MSEHDPDEQSQDSYVAGYGRTSIQRRWNQGNTLRKFKELFLFGASDVQYVPLPGPLWIRLLAIEPGKAGSVLRCSLRPVDLEKNPRYTALSYTWQKNPTMWDMTTPIFKEIMKQLLRGERPQVGLPEYRDPDSARTIMCNGKPTNILPNLYDALAQLRQKRPGDYWIDALCINQSDTDERASQVQQMGRIYQSAGHVIIWLGTLDDDDSSGIPHLKTLARLDSDRWDIRSMHHGAKIIVPPDLVIEGRGFDSAISAAMLIVISQWFRRVWVLQELCFAKHVTFSMGDEEMSIQDVITGFKVAQYFYFNDVLRTATKLWGSRMNELELIFENFWSKYGPIWAPQIQLGSQLILDAVPRTLQAREIFKEGGKWTLGQWLWACRGRTSTDLRDLIFGGLSLIKQESLQIDQNMLIAEPASLRFAEGPPLLLKHRYPQMIPPRGMCSMKPATTEGILVEKQSLLPNGLWKALKADYTVNEAEVLVNAAACLLTNTGTAEILSISSRIRRSNVFTSKWVIAPVDKTTVEDLPSWVPTPGSWTSRMNQVLAFRESSGFAASGEITSEPRISVDGRALFLDASRFDEIDEFILDARNISHLDIDVLIQLLASIRELPTWYHSSHRSSFTTLARVILSGTAEDSSEFPRNAAKWFCHTLSAAVTQHIFEKRAGELINSPRRYEHSEMSNDEFIDSFHSCHSGKQNELDDLMETFGEVKAKHSEEPWPTNLDPTASDRTIHIQILRHIAEHSKEADREWRKLSASRKPHAAQSRENVQKKIQGSRKIPIFNFEYPVQNAGLEEAAKFALAWQKVFITKRGFLGLGPKWMTKGDSVMLIHGAPIPYVFAPLDSDLRRQQRDLLEALDKIEQEYNETTLRKQSHNKLHIGPWSVLRQKRRDTTMKKFPEKKMLLEERLHRVSRESYRKDAWVLMGEAYVEGIMHGEAVKGCHVERIVVV